MVAPDRACTTYAASRPIPACAVTPACAGVFNADGSFHPDKEATWGQVATMVVGAAPELFANLPPQLAGAGPTR